MKTSIKKIGRTVTKSGWEHTAWLVEINGVAFEYRTGTGISDKKLPEMDDVLECLFSDASAGQESFNDFCENMGLSTDSISAFDTYRSCMECEGKLRKALGAKYYEERDRLQERAS
jgi:hypothetical protein